MISASLLLAHRVANLQLRNIRAITDPDDETPPCEEAMTILRAAKGRIMLYHLSGPLSFGAAKDMAKRLNLIGGYEALVLDLSDVPTIDSTTGMAIEDMINNARSSGRHVLLSGAQPYVRGILQGLGVLRALDSDKDFPRRLHALRKAAMLLGIDYPGKTQPAETATTV